MTGLRVDVLTIFPDYLAPARLALLGRAQHDGLLVVRPHDLRDWTTDRHRTVDDTPYGGGPGMVMGPEPWGAAIDSLLGDPPFGAVTPVLVVPTPSGSRLNQALATTLAEEAWLIVACGRYEGIDQRVVDHYATRLRVVEVSLGDYVLSGGEAAALVLIEAVARLLPGFVGNAASLDEESHGADADGALEYPVYTKPASWRGLDVPEVLRSGDHGRIAGWRREQAVQRTAARRPDLAHASRAFTVAGLTERAEVALAQPADAPELLVLQRCCWVSEALANETLDIPPLVETLDDVRVALAEWTTFTVRVEGRLVGSVRGRLVGGNVWDIGRVMVAPDLEGRGLGRWLIAHAERSAPPEATSYRLFTGARSERNLRMYRRAGYRREPRAEGAANQGVVTLSRPALDRDDFG